MSWHHLARAGTKLPVLGHHTTACSSPHAVLHTHSDSAAAAQRGLGPRSAVLCPNKRATHHPTCSCQQLALGLLGVGNPLTPLLEGL